MASPKGGVGKTTLAANLAFALQRQGIKVSAIDFDSQNALRLHFGLPLKQAEGYVTQSVHTAHWQQLVHETESGVRLLPYGQTSREQQRVFDAFLQEHPEQIRAQLTPMLNKHNAVVMVDLPPGPSCALDAILPLSPIMIVVLHADGSSLSTLPQLQDNSFFGGEAPRTFYIINQLDRRSRLNRDVSQFLEEQLGASLLGMVHRDEAAPEAGMEQQSIFQYAPSSAAAKDIENIARNISRMLPTQ